MRKRNLLLVRFWIVVMIVLISSVEHTTIALGEDSGDDISQEASGSGGGCIYTGTSTEEFSESPPVCSGVVTVYTSFGAVEGKENTCSYFASGEWDCDQGVWKWQLAQDFSNVPADPQFVEAPCQWSSSPYNSCEINEWTGKFVCGFWDYTLKAEAGLPCATLDIEPYPATMVRWPTYLRFSGAGSSSANATLDFNGRGTADHPLPGDRKNIRLTLHIQPFMNYMQVHLPRAGYYQGDGKRCIEVENFSLPLQNSTSPPKTSICWNVPSHPAAGAGPLAGSVSGMDELPADFPLFMGWAAVPYQAVWNMSYEKWQVVDKECKAGPSHYDKDGNPIYQCKTTDSSLEKDGHWVDIYGWKRHSEGGMIDPALVSGLPDYMKADLNGDGQPDAFWGSGVRVRRMNEAWRVDDPVYGRSWQCRTQLPFAVREGQTQSIYLNP